MKYSLIEADSSDDLETKVNDVLEDGWKLQGGVSVAASGGVDLGGLLGSWYYYQALVK